MDSIHSHKYIKCWPHTHTHTLEHTLGYKRACIQKQTQHTRARSPMRVLVSSHNECSTHAQHQPPSYHQSAKQSNSKRINTAETVEYALSKGTATEIGTSNYSAKSNCRYACKINNNNNHNNNAKKYSVSSSSGISADSDAKNMSGAENCRDRLGFWGHDSEVAGAVSGLERLRLPRYNKVKEITTEKQNKNSNSNTRIRVRFGQ